MGGGRGRATGKDKNPAGTGTGARTESNAERAYSGMTETEGKRRQVGFSSCFSMQRSKLVPCTCQKTFHTTKLHLGARQRLPAEASVCCFGTGDEPGALCILGKFSTAKLPPPTVTKESRMDVLKSKAHHVFP